MSESYDYYINIYEKLLNECSNKENSDICKKLQIIKFLRGQYGTSFRDFQQNYNAFINQTTNDDDINVWENQYNEYYKEMLIQRQKIEKEIKDLDDLIKYQNSNSESYEKVLIQRNDEIKTNVTNLNNKTDNLATLNQDLKINDKNTDIIYLFGWIPLSPYPMKTKNVLQFYQMVNVFLLLFLIFFIKAIKQFKKKIT